MKNHMSNPAGAASGGSANQPAKASYRHHDGKSTLSIDVGRHRARARTKEIVAGLEHRAEERILVAGKDGAKIKA